MKLVAILFLLFVFNSKAQIPVPADSIFHLSNVNDVQATMFKNHLQKIATERWFKRDSAFVANFYHSNLVHTHENGRSRNKEQMLRIRSTRQSQLTSLQAEQNQQKISIENVVVQVYNKTAVVHYFIDMRLVLNNQPVFKLFKCTDVFIKNRKDWQLVSHTETAVPGTPTAVKINTTVYKDYVGDYRLTPDVIYTVSEKEGRLYWGRNQGFELIPEAENIFGFKIPPTSSSPNALYRIHFVRNAEGNVTHLHMIEYAGVEYDAIKIK